MTSNGSNKAAVETNDNAASKAHAETSDSETSKPFNNVAFNANNGLSFNSLTEILVALKGNRYAPRDIYAYFHDNYKTVRGSEVDYHNLSVEFSRISDAFALFTAQVGVKNYRLSADLLADVIKYAQEIGELSTCRSGLEQLHEIDRRYWTWRTFVFVIDFWKDSLCTSKDVSEFQQNIGKAWELIGEFKKHIPHDERAYVSEAEIYERQNEYENALNALLKGTESCPVSPTCCMKLADMYMERGKYENAEKYARKGILAALQEQPSVSVGYLYFLLAMSMDAQRIRARQTDTSYSPARIQAIVTAYQTADELLINEGRITVSYRQTIKARLIIIEKEEKVSVKIPEDSDGETPGMELLRSLLLKKGDSKQADD